MASRGLLQVLAKGFYVVFSDNQREACRAAPGRLGANEEQQGEGVLLSPEDAGQPMGRAGGLEGARGEDGRSGTGWNLLRSSSILGRATWRRGRRETDVGRRSWWWRGRCSVLWLEG